MTTCPQGHQTSASDYCDVCGAPIASAPAAPPAAPSAPPAPAAPAEARSCPHCAASNVADALFCEACGYDFTTGTMPRPEASSIPTPTRPDELDDAPAGGDAPSPAAAGGSAGEGAASGSTAAGNDGSGDAGAGAADGATSVPAQPGPPTGDATGQTEWVAEIWIDPDWYACQNSADPMPSPGLPEVVALQGTSLLIGRVSRSRNIHPDIDCEADSGVSRRQAQLSTDGSRWFVEDLESANGTFVGPASGPMPKDPIAVGQRIQIDADDRLYVGAWTRMVIRRAAPGEV